MTISKSLYGLAIVLVLGLTVGIYAQSLPGDAMKVNLPNDVVVGNKTLTAGEYEIRKETFVNPVLRIYNRDEMKYETAFLTIPTEDNKEVEESKVVMEKVGNDFYLTKVWLAGRSIGFEIPLPERARELKRELARTVPAQSSSSTVAIVTEAEPEALPTEQDQVAVNLDELGEPIAAVQESIAGVVEEGQPLLESEEQVALAQESEDRESLKANDAEQDIQRAKPEAAEAAEAAEAESEGVEPAQSEAAPAQLPATASNWLAYLLAGLTLTGLAAAVRRS